MGPKKQLNISRRKKSSNEPSLVGLGIGVHIFFRSLLSGKGASSGHVKVHMEAGAAVGAPRKLIPPGTSPPQVIRVTGLFGQVGATVGVGTVDPGADPKHFVEQTQLHSAKAGVKASVVLPVP